MYKLENTQRYYYKALSPLIKYLNATDQISIHASTNPSRSGSRSATP
jgi:hypothetical protein